MKKAAPRKNILRPAAILAALLAAGLIVRVIFLIELERSGFADVLALDSRLYRDVAHTIVAGGALPGGPLTFNPLYAAFLVVMFKLFGEGLLAPRIVQIALGLLTIALVYAAGRRLVEGSRKEKLSGEATALVAAGMAVLYSPFVLYEGMLVATALEIFFMTASFALALAIDDDLRGGRPLMLGSRRVSPRLASLLLGALCGAGALGRPNLFLLLIASLPVWLLVRSRRARVGLILAAACLAGAALFVLPPIAYNAKTTGRFVPVTAHGGINFYTGNRLGSAGVFRPLDESRANIEGAIEDARVKAEEETGRSMTQAEVSDYYVRRALEDIGRDPAAWLRLLGRKLMLFLNGAKMSDLPNVYFYEKSCGVLKLLFLPFAVIAPLGVCGLVILMRSGRNRSVVSVFLACTLVSVLLFFVNARYRLPAVPILILLAALSLAWAAREISLRRARDVAIMAAAAATLFFLVSHRTMLPANHSFEYAFLGNYYIEHKDEAKAEEAFAEAYRIEPDKMEAIINYARILRERGRMRESAEMYARAYARMPRFPDLAIEYGFVLQLLGRLEDSKKLYLEASSSSRAPERATACKLLAQAAAMEGMKDAAIQWVKRALEIEPQDPQAADMLRRIEGMPPSSMLSLPKPRR